MTVDIYDAVVVGSGEAGKSIAWSLGKAGKRVIVIEDRYIGGSCPNIACLPSKNIIHSAEIAHIVRTAGGLGAPVSGMAAVQTRKRKMVEGLIATHLQNFKASGAELVMGRGIFVGERTVEIDLHDGGKRIVGGDKVFLDLGAFASVPDLPGLKEAEPLTHVELLDLDTLPQRLVILGGGYIALEFAQAMARLGAHVSVCERAERLLPREDPDISAEVADLLKAEGVAILTGADIRRVSGRSGEAVTLHGALDGQTIEGTHLLVALGKAPNTIGIGLERAGVEVTAAGYVRVNERLETSAANVWAMGDCAGSPPFTHMAFEDFRIVRDNLAGGARSTAGRQTPSCLFLDPELARVGLNETQAKAQNVAYRLAELPVAKILRTRATGETRGKLKALIGADDRILGFTALAPRAGELLPPIQLAMAAGLPYQAIEALTIAHPTYAEALVSLFASVPAA